jgi:MFS family permease
LWFGLITATAGVGGALLGGWFSDLGRKRAGLRGRLSISILGGAIATGGALAVSGNQAALVLLGLGLWVFASTVAAIGAIAILQDVVPNQFRGTAVSILTFCNTLMGLGCGPTLVALATDHVYGVPTAVGFAISTVVVPAGAIAIAAFALCRRQLAKNIVAADPATNPVKSPA